MAQDESLISHKRDGVPFPLLQPKRNFLWFEPKQNFEAVFSCESTSTNHIMLKNKTRSGAAAKFLKEMLVLTIVASRNAFALLHHKETTS